jgi:succinate dehydrogenase hydrophobic anchor subunit
MRNGVNTQGRGYSWVCPKITAYFLATKVVVPVYFVLMQGNIAIKVFLSAAKSQINLVKYEKGSLSGEF